MKKIHLVLPILILLACNVMSQTESGNKKSGEKEKTRTESTLHNSKKADASNDNLFVEGDIDITGDYKINGVPIHLGGGNTLSIPIEITATTHQLPNEGGIFAYTNPAQIIVSKADDPVDGAIWYLYQHNTGQVGTDWQLGTPNTLNYYGTAQEGYLMTIQYWGTSLGYVQIAGVPFTPPQTYGPELLADHHFDNNNMSNDFIIIGEDDTHIVTFADGKMRCQSDTTWPVLGVRQEGVLTIGKTYRFEYKVSSTSNTAMRFESFGVGINVLETTPGVYFIEGVADRERFYLVRGGSDVDQTLDYVSMKEIF